MRKSKAKIIAYGLLIAISLSSCGRDKKMEKPELLEPKVTNESYRPVERGDVGAIKVKHGEQLYMAKVVANQKSYFWTTSVKIDEISVKVGDYVEAGQVLASADLEDAYEVLQSYRAELANENAVFEKKQEIYTAQHGELEYKIKGASENGLSTSELEKQLNVLEENNRYDVKLHDFYVASIGRKIAEEAKITEDSRLIATQSGYVTYVKDIKDSNVVTASDAVVVIADTNNLYVESEQFTENPGDRRKIPEYTGLYTTIEGVRYDLVEYPYTDEELAVAENKGLYPKLRYKFVDETATPELGTNLLLFFAVDVHEDVLKIGNDSVEKDSQGYYVYVLVDGKKEVRRVEIGKKDEYYVEVISGLEEGELVYFSSLSASPEEYEPHEVNATDFIVTAEIPNKKKVTTESKVFYSEFDGIINEIAVESGATVSAGDLICNIKTSSGSAMLTEMSVGMSDLKENYDKQMKDFDAAMAELQLQIDGIDAAALAAATAPDTATLTDAAPAVVTTPNQNQPQDPYIRQELELMLTQISCQKQIATIQYEYQLANMQKAYQKASKNNNGNGIIGVYAEKDGVVSDIKVHEGKNIKFGDRLFDIKIPTEERIVANPFANLSLGQTINILDKESKKSYTATVLGGAGYEPICLFDFKDGHVYITTTSSDQRGNQYYIKLDDESISDDIDKLNMEYIACKLNGAVVIGRNDVHVEVIQETEHYYVWKIVDGILVKQYVSLFAKPSMDSDVVCIVSGLKHGEIVAGQKGLEEND